MLKRNRALESSETRNESPHRLMPKEGCFHGLGAAVPGRVFWTSGIECRKIIRVRAIVYLHSAPGPGRGQQQDHVSKTLSSFLCAPLHVSARTVSAPCLLVCPCPLAFESSPVFEKNRLHGTCGQEASADREKGSNRSGAGGFKWLPAWIGCCPSSLSVSVQRHAYQGGTGDRHVNVSGRHFHKQVQVFVVVPALLSRALSTGSHTVSLRPLSPPGGRLLLRRGGDGQRELEHAFETRGPCMKAQHEFA